MPNGRRTEKKYDGFGPGTAHGEVSVGTQADREPP